MRVKNWLNDNEQVKDFISGTYGLYEGEGLEEAFAAWKTLPKEDRTEENLIRVCKENDVIDIDQYDPPDWIPNI
jgi:hypothetical protein